MVSLKWQGNARYGHLQIPSNRLKVVVEGILIIAYEYTFQIYQEEERLPTQS